MHVIDMAWLDQLADVAGAKVEVDRDGGVCVFPASDGHVVAATRLAVQFATQIPADMEVIVEGPRWSPIGDTGPSYVPDLAVVAKTALARPDRQLALSPPPILVVEILSPSTSRRDLGEKADGYCLGGATVYWTIEIPGLSDVDHPSAVIRERGPDGWVTTGRPRQGQLQFIPGFPFATLVTIDLDQLAG
ncbi:MAG: Uma2 family endonuclease [Acidimicrobiales bacterium]